jgi:hypothetical protein
MLFPSVSMARTWARRSVLIRFILNIMRERSDGKTPPYAHATIEPMAKHPPRPRDPNQLAKLIVDIATGEAQDPDTDAGKDAKMAALGRQGGVKGGKARAAALSAEERSESAKRAANARWSKVGQRSA